MCLQWPSDSLHDMYADSVLAVVLQVEAHCDHMCLDGEHVQYECVGVCSRSVWACAVGVCGRVQGVCGRVQGVCGRVQGVCGRVQGVCGRVQGVCGRMQYECVCACVRVQ